MTPTALVKEAFSTESCAAGEVHIAVDGSGRGLLIGVADCAFSANGPTVKRAFAARYEDHRFSAIPQASLPLGAAWKPESVDCLDGACTVVANRSPNAAMPEEKTSTTVLVYRDGAWTVESDELEQQRVLEPKAIALREDEAR